MEDYIAIVFDDDIKAYHALHALWHLDAEGRIIVHGAAVIRRDAYGYVDVATKDLDTGLRVAMGIGIGALLGGLAGPFGAALGPAAGIGAAAGGLAGVAADVEKSSEREQAKLEASFMLARGKSAVIAEVSEEWTAPIDEMASRLGGTVFRRSKSDVRRDMWFDGDYPEYLYPYDYEPHYA
jgi:uncharacterized membrane protein